MRFNRVGQKFASWLAAIAMLLAAAAPTISHALQGGPPASWFEVCSTQAVSVNGADAEGKTPLKSPAQILGHCLYCSLHGNDIALPTAPVQPDLAALTFEPPRLDSFAPRAAFARRAVQARAPPASLDA